ncbi:hypothetical protein SEVIR_9G195250v4 [Setaria viridis]
MAGCCAGEDGKGTASAESWPDKAPSSTTADTAAATTPTVTSACRPAAATTPSSERGTAIEPSAVPSLDLAVTKNSQLYPIVISDIISVLRSQFQLLICFGVPCSASLALMFKEVFALLFIRSLHFFYFY